MGWFDYGAPLRDFDGDSFSDIDEMLAGTDPKDPKSYPGKLVTPTPAPTPTPTPTPPVAPPVKPLPWGLIIGIIIAVVIVVGVAYYFYTKRKA